MACKPTLLLRNIPLRPGDNSTNVPYSVTAVSAVRLYYLFNIQLDPEQDFTMTMADGLIWTGVEVNMAIICGRWQTLMELS